MLVGELRAALAEYDADDEVFVRCEVRDTGGWLWDLPILKVRDTPDAAGPSIVVDD